MRTFLLGAAIVTSLALQSFIAAVLFTLFEQVERVANALHGKIEPPEPAPHPERGRY